MWISRKVYEDLKKEHNRTVEALTAWIESLQAEKGAPSVPIVRAPQATVPLEMALYEGDDESDLRDALDMGLIDQNAFEEGMRQIGLQQKAVEDFDRRAS